MKRLSESDLKGSLDNKDTSNTKKNNDKDKKDNNEDRLKNDYQLARSISLIQAISIFKLGESE